MSEYVVETKTTITKHTFWRDAELNDCGFCSPPSCLPTDSEDITGYNYRREEVPASSPDEENRDDTNAIEIEGRIVLPKKK